MWDANLVAVGRPEAGFAALARDADAAQRGRPHRMLVVDGDAGAALAAEAAEAGWLVERHVAMVAARAPEARDGRPTAEQVPPDTVLPTRRTTIEEVFPGDTALSDAIVLWDAALGAAAHELAFASFAPDGWMAAYARLFPDDVARVGQIEDVMTLAAYRNQGHASAVVLAALHASRAAGHEVTFLWADEGGWPVALYGRLGFDVAGRRWRMQRSAP